jgi:hypothetical protein
VGPILRVKSATAERRVIRGLIDGQIAFEGKWKPGGTGVASIIGVAKITDAQWKRADVIIRSVTHAAPPPGTRDELVELVRIYMEMRNIEEKSSVSNCRHNLAAARDSIERSLKKIVSLDGNSCLLLQKTGMTANEIRSMCGLILQNLDRARQAADKFPSIGLTTDAPREMGAHLAHRIERIFGGKYLSKSDSSLYVQLLGFLLELTDIISAGALPSRNLRDEALQRSEDSRSHGPPLVASQVK